MANDNNVFDFTQFFSQLNVPGLDVQSIIESSRKDWEALQAASQNSMQGWQSVAQRQNELAQEAIAQWQKDLTESVGRSPEENAEKLRANVEAAMANMRELAEIINKSQTEAAEILRQRFEENLQRITNPGAGDKGGDAAG